MTLGSICPIGTAFTNANQSYGSTSYGAAVKVDAPLATG